MVLECDLFRILPYSSFEHNKMPFPPSTDPKYQTSSQRHCTYYMPLWFLSKPDFLGISAPRPSSSHIFMSIIEVPSIDRPFIPSHRRSLDIDVSHQQQHQQMPNLQDAQLLAHILNPPPHPLFHSLSNPTASASQTIMEVHVLMSPSLPKSVALSTLTLKSLFTFPTISTACPTVKCASRFNIAVNAP